LDLFLVEGMIGSFGPFCSAGRGKTAVPAQTGVRGALSCTVYLGSFGPFLVEGTTKIMAEESDA
jgi:hypothetical protein